MQKTISNRTMKSLSVKLKMTLIDIEGKHYENRILKASIAFVNRNPDLDALRIRNELKGNWLK